MSGDPAFTARARLPLPEAALTLLANETFRQLFRFAVAGLSVTLFAAAIYALAATMLQVPPLVANAISHGCGVAAGYTVHSRWSFAADKDAGERGMIARFALASGFAFLLNSLWVWLATDVLHLPPLAPLPAMIVLTPLLSFVLNRYWVFRVA